jgi:mycothiol system anti-sigma-R factor
MDEQDDHQTGPSGERPFWLDKSGCREAIDTLYHFLDGELTTERRLEITVHLHECAPCLDAFDFEAEIKAVVARKCRDQVPDALRQRVFRALMEASGQPPGTEYRWE